MYETIRGLIQRKKYKSFSALKNKLIIYNAAELISDYEVEQLLAYGREVYGDD